MKIDRHTMIIGDVAKILGVSVSRVQQLDDELKPTRHENGHRRYDPADVERYAAGRGK